MMIIYDTYVGIHIRIYNEGASCIIKSVDVEN